LEKEKLEISQILDKLTTATERGNIDQIKGIWLESENDLLIGTESNEKLEGWNEIQDALKKQFRTFHETLISITDQSIWISEDGKIAWFYEELNYNFVFEDQAMEFKGIRVTGVLKKTEGKWRMVNQHLSVPAKLNMVKSR
jgi:ketosteroid isomerase-like protein